MGDRLALCPDSRNCVSSEALSERHSISPIVAFGETDEIVKRLAETIESMPGGKVAIIDGPYLRAEFTSKLFRFIDDLECRYDENNEVIHVRSASRAGYSDFGANRRRVESLRSLMEVGQ